MQPSSAAIEDHGSQLSMSTALASENWYGRHGQSSSVATTHTRTLPNPSEKQATSDTEQVQQLEYHHQPYEEVQRKSSADQDADTTPAANEHRAFMSTNLSPNPYKSSAYGDGIQRPLSTSSNQSLLNVRNASRSPQTSPYEGGRGSARKSPDTRPMSYIDLLNVPYPQLPAPAVAHDNDHIRGILGNRATLLSPVQTLEMYRANVKKTTDPAIQYEFALLMVTTAQENVSNGSISAARTTSPAPSEKSDSNSPAAMIREARQILQRLADRSYPFAQYYLGDGYFSGLFNNGKEDHDKAFSLFVSASKHGHAEASYRAALCYEYGWGTKRDGAKALQFHRQAASKNHPGAMSRMSRACLYGEFGQGVKYREGIKWLKRAVESADAQYNSAPYELGLLHEAGYGDDIFQDEAYAAQLFTKAADLGHAEAGYRLGDAYEHGKLTCPRDAALSIHFYNCAAQLGNAEAMMALCAWYMVGAEPVLEQDENEAYEWARQAAEAGLVKAQYAVGFFTESGIGCRRDVLEANVWYVKAGEAGDERAKHRLAAIRAAASGESPYTVAAKAAPNSTADLGSSIERKKQGQLSEDGRPASKYTLASAILCEQG